MTTILNGLLGGVVAAVIAELVGRALSAVSPSTKTMRAESGGDADKADTGDSDRAGVGDEADGAYRPRAAVVRLVSGGVAGGVLVGLELYALGLLAVPPELGTALLVSVGWSIALFLGSASWRTLVSGARPLSGDLVRALVRYLVFGAALGLWIRLTWIT